MSFYGVTDIWSYLLGAVAIILLPGPNSLYVLSVATTRGIRAGFQGALGVFAGDSVLLLLTALGAASVLRAHPGLFMVVKYLGAAYLAWVGLNLIWGSLQKWRSTGHALPVAEASQPSTAAKNQQMAQPFKRAFVISLLNPKAILFLLSFFVQFIDPAYARPMVPFLILSAIVMACSAVYLSALIFAGTRLAQTFARQQRLSSGLSGGVGGLFVWFGAKLASASLS